MSIWRLNITNMVKNHFSNWNLNFQLEFRTELLASFQQHVAVVFRDSPMAHLIHLKHIYRPRKEQDSGKIQSLVPMSHLSDGMHMVSKHMEATLHQRLCYGRDQVKWVKGIQQLLLSGEIMVNQFQVESNSNHLEIAGSFQQHQRLLNNLSEFTDLYTTKNTIKMALLDSISGSRMRGMVSMLTTDCQVNNTEVDSDPGPPKDHTLRHGGCLSSRRLMPN